LAAGGLPFIGGAAGVGRDHGHLRERHVQLLGRDLGERRDDALPKLHLAGEDRHLAVGADADPGIEHAVGLEAAWQPGPLLAECKAWCEAERQDDAAEAGCEITPRERVHDHVLPLAWTARRTARTMRLWVPQRQRLLASAARTSCSLGRGVRLSSSAAVMIMPLAQ